MAKNGWSLIIYDLDGTLLDAFLDIAIALNSALENNGFDSVPLPRVKSYVGNGMDMLVKRAIPEAELPILQKVIRETRSFYQAHPADTASLYPGVEPTLIQIKKAGLRQIILTNKPHAVAINVCLQVGLTDLVDAVQGEAKGKPLKPDPSLAEDILEHYDTAPKNVVMVGDGVADIQFGLAAKFLTVGCSWGVTSFQKLEDLNPQHIIHRMEELPLVLSLDL